MRALVQPPPRASRIGSASRVEYIARLLKLTAAAAARRRACRRSGAGTPGRRGGIPARGRRRPADQRQRRCADGERQRRRRSRSESPARVAKSSAAPEMSNGAVARAVLAGQPAPADQQGEEHDRRVEPKDGPPARRPDQQAAQWRPGRRRQETAPPICRTRALVERGTVAHQRRPIRQRDAPAIAWSVRQPISTEKSGPSPRAQRRGPKPVKPPSNSRRRPAGRRASPPPAGSRPWRPGRR